MKASREEKERKYYNRKLLREATRDGIKNEFKKESLFEWKSFLVTLIGIILASEIVDIINPEKLISNAAALYAVELLIWAAVILAVQLIAGVIKRIIKNKHNQK